MTAANIFLSRRGAHLLFDTAIYDQSAHVLGLQSKVVSSDRLALAIGTNGTHSERACSHLQDWLESCSCQKSALAAVPRLATEISAIVRDDIAHNNDGSFTQSEAVGLFIGAWVKELCKPVAFVFCLEQQMFPSNYHPGKLQFAPRYVSPLVREEFMPPVGVCEEYDVLTAARRLMSAQRLQPDHMGRFVVGGGGELVTVGPGGVERTAVVQWADKIGRQVRPSRWRDALAARMPCHFFVAAKPR